MAAEGILINLDDSDDAIKQLKPSGVNHFIANLNADIEAEISAELKKHTLSNLPLLSDEVLDNSSSNDSAQDIADLEFNLDDLLLSPERQVDDDDDVFLASACSKKERHVGTAHFTDNISNSNNNIDFSSLTSSQYAQIFLEAGKVATNLCKGNQNKIGKKPKNDMFLKTHGVQSILNDLKSSGHIVGSTTNSGSSNDSVFKDNGSNSSMTKSLGSQHNSSQSLGDSDGSSKNVGPHGASSKASFESFKKPALNSSTCSTKSENKENINRAVKRTGSFKIPKTSVAPPSLSALKKPKSLENIPESEANQPRKAVKKNLKNVTSKISTWNTKHPTVNKDTSTKMNTSTSSTVSEPSSKKVQRNKFGGSLRVTSNTAPVRSKLLTEKSMPKDDISLKPTTSLASKSNQSPSQAHKSAVKPVIRKTLGHFVGQKPSNQRDAEESSIAKPKIIKAHLPKPAGPMKVIKPVTHLEPPAPVVTCNPPSTTCNMSLNVSDMPTAGLYMLTPAGKRKTSSSSTSSSMRPKSASDTAFNSSHANTDFSITFDSPPNDKYMVASSTPASFYLANHGPPSKKGSFLPTPNFSRNRSQRASSASSANSDDSLKKSGAVPAKLARVISFEACNQNGGKSKVKQFVKKVLK